MKITEDLLEKAITNDACVGGIEWGRKNIGNDYDWNEKLPYGFWTMQILTKEQQLQEIKKESFKKAVLELPYPAIRYCSELLTKELIDQLLLEKILVEDFKKKDFDVANAMMIYTIDFMTKEQIAICKINSRPKAK